MNKLKYTDILYDPNRGEKFETDWSHDVPMGVAGAGAGSNAGAGARAGHANDIGFARPRPDNKPPLYAQEHLQEERKRAYHIKVKALYVHGVNHGMGVSYFFIPPAAALMLGWEPKIYLGDDDGTGAGIAGIEGQGLALGAKLDKELRDYLEKGEVPDEQLRREKDKQAQDAQDELHLAAGVYGVGVQGGAQGSTDGWAGHGHGYEYGGIHSFEMGDDIIKGFREGAEAAHHAQEALDEVLGGGDVPEYWHARAEAVMKEFDEAVQEGAAMYGLGGIVPERADKLGDKSDVCPQERAGRMHKYGSQTGGAQPDVLKVVPTPE